MLRHVIGDGEQLERGQWARHDIDMVALDQLLRLVLGAGRVAAGIGDDEFDLAPGQGHVAVLEERGEALLHLDAALGERARLHAEEAEPQGRALRERDAGQRRRCRGGGRTKHDGTAVELIGHGVSSRLWG